MFVAMRSCPFHCKKGAGEEDERVGYLNTVIVKLVYFQPLVAFSVKL